MPSIFPVIIPWKWPKINVNLLHKELVICVCYAEDINILGGGVEEKVICFRFQFILHSEIQFYLADSVMDFSGLGLAVFQVLFIYHRLRAELQSPRGPTPAPTMSPPPKCCEITHIQRNLLSLMMRMPLSLEAGGDSWGLYPAPFEGIGMGNYRKRAIPRDSSGVLSSPQGSTPRMSEVGNLQRAD